MWGPLLSRLIAQAYRELLAAEAKPGTGRPGQAIKAEGIKGD